MKVRKIHNLYSCRKRRHRSVTRIYRKTKIPSTVRDSATSSSSLAHPKPPEIRRNDAASTDTHDSHSLPYLIRIIFSHLWTRLPLLYRMLYLIILLFAAADLCSFFRPCFALNSFVTQLVLLYPTHTLFFFAFEYWTCIHVQDY